MSRTVITTWSIRSMFMLDVGSKLPARVRAFPPPRIAGIVCGDRAQRVLDLRRHDSPLAEDPGHAAQRVAGVAQERTVAPTVDPPRAGRVARAREGPAQPCAPKRVSHREPPSFAGVAYARRVMADDRVGH